MTEGDTHSHWEGGRGERGRGALSGLSSAPTSGHKSWGGSRAKPRVQKCSPSLGPASMLSYMWQHEVDKQSPWDSRCCCNRCRRGPRQWPVPCCTADPVLISLPHLVSVLNLYSPQHFWCIVRSLKSLLKENPGAFLWVYHGCLNFTIYYYCCYYYDYILCYNGVGYGIPTKIIPFPQLTFPILLQQYSPS